MINYNQIGVELNLNATKISHKMINLQSLLMDSSTKYLAKADCPCELDAVEKLEHISNKHIINVPKDHQEKSVASKVRIMGTISLYSNITFYNISCYNLQGPKKIQVDATPWPA